MNNIIKSDLKRYYGRTGTKDFFKALSIPGFKYMTVVRLLNHYSNPTPIRFILLLLKRRYTIKYGIQIPTTTKIGAGFYGSPQILGGIKRISSNLAGHGSKRYFTVHFTARDPGVL